MRDRIVQLFRDLLPSSIQETDEHHEEFVLSIRLPERGKWRMVVCRTTTYRNVRRWRWNWLGVRLYECTEVTVVDPYSGSAKPCYQRTYDYIVSREGIHDSVIAALESDYSWYREQETVDVAVL